jgi:hypothetical protein
MTICPARAPLAAVTWRGALGPALATLLVALALLGATSLPAAGAQAFAQGPTLAPVSDSTAVDADGDLVADDQEMALGLDPLDADTDHDGLDDGIEIWDSHGWDTDPLNPDTDRDSLGDGEEVFGRWWGYVTDPTRWDTDGDGFGDATEPRLFLSDPLDPNDHEPSGSW